MNITIKVASGGKKGNKDLCHVVTYKDVTDIEEIHAGLEKDFREYFPVYQRLDQIPPGNKSKKEKAEKE